MLFIRILQAGLIIKPDCAPLHKRYHYHLRTYINLGRVWSQQVEMSGLQSVNKAPACLVYLYSLNVL